MGFAQWTCCCGVFLSRYDRRKGDLLDRSCASVRMVFLISDSSVLFISGGICAFKGFGLRVVRCSCTRIE